MAEGLLRVSLPEDGWSVESAGTQAIGGDPPTPEAQDAVATTAGVDISTQRSIPVTVDLLRRCDQILTMSRQQALEVAALAPEVGDRTRLLGAFAPAPAEFDGPADPWGLPAEPDEIPDPMGGDDATYQSCCARLALAVDAVAAWLESGADAAAAPPPVADWPVE